MKYSIEFVLFDDALGLDITGPLEVFQTACALLAEQGRSRDGYAFFFAGAHPGPIRLSSGLVIYAPNTIGDANYDIMLIPGGPGVMTACKNNDLVNRIAEQAGRADLVISICNGAYVLAEAGLLDHKRITTHWLMADDLAGRHPKVRVTADAIFMRDGKIATSAGVTSGIDLALDVVEEAFGSALALAVARRLVLYYRRPGWQSQFSEPLQAGHRAGKRFRRLHDWMRNHLHAPLTIERLARQAGMSTRNFSRVFTEKTGMTPAKYLETLRLDVARELLIAGQDAIARVAEHSGFGREERLRRAFYRRFGIGPSQYRAHFSQKNKTGELDDHSRITNWT